MTEFDFRTLGYGRSASSRYANNSNYRNDSLIRKESTSREEDEREGRQADTMQCVSAPFSLPRSSGS